MANYVSQTSRFSRFADSQMTSKSSVFSDNTSRKSTKTKGALNNAKEQNLLKQVKAGLTHLDLKTE